VRGRPVPVGGNVATARSERGWGSWPETADGAAFAAGASGVTTDCTVATVSGEPPPRTYVREPKDTAAASWTPVASRLPAEAVPVVGARVVTPASDVPAGEMPPRTVSPVPAATTDSRERGASSCQGSTPASIDGGVKGLAAVDVSRCVTCAFDATGNARIDDDADPGVLGEPPPTSQAVATPTTTNDATRPTAAIRRRRTCARRCSRARVDRCSGPPGLTGML
jgi:hypothetical protein